MEDIMVDKDAGFAGSFDAGDKIQAFFGLGQR